MFSSDGRFLLGSDEDDCVIIFDARDGSWTPRARFEGAGVMETPQMLMTPLVLERQLAEQSMRSPLEHMSMPVPALPSREQGSHKTAPNGGGAAKHVVSPTPMNGDVHVYEDDARRSLLYAKGAGAAEATRTVNSESESKLDSTRSNDALAKVLELRAEIFQIEEEQFKLERMITYLDDHLESGLHMLTSADLLMWLHDLGLDASICDPLSTVTGAMLMTVTVDDLELIGIGLPDAARLLLHCYIAHYKLGPLPCAALPSGSLLSWSALETLEWAVSLGPAFASIAEVAKKNSWTGACLASLTRERIMQAGNGISAEQSNDFLHAVKDVIKQQIDDDQAASWTQWWSGSTPLHALPIAQANDQFSSGTSVSSTECSR